MSRPEDDAAWRDIIDSYGDRPEFPEAPKPDLLPADPGAGEAQPAELSSIPWEDEGHYVPPAPPPVPRPRGLRAVAWFGIFGVPALMLVLLLVHYSPPSPTGLLMIVWFVGGFAYLVATMSGPRDPDSGWDDGAVL